MYLKNISQVGGKIRKKDFFGIFIPLPSIFDATHKVYSSKMFSQTVTITCACILCITFHFILVSPVHVNFIPVRGYSFLYCYRVSSLRTTLGYNVLSVHRQHFKVPSTIGEWVFKHQGYVQESSKKAVTGT